METSAHPVLPCPRRRASDRGADVASPSRGAPTPAVFDAVFDEIDIGLLVCEDDGTVVMLNWAARLELAAGQVLRLDAHGLRSVAEGRELSNALLCAGRQGRRAVLELRRGSDRLFVSVSPLARDGARPLALVILGRRAPCSAHALDMLAHKHGLTTAERRVLAALLAQRTPTQIAADHDTAISTVRTQINALRAKLGANSVATLMCVLAGVPAPSPALKPAHAAGMEAAFAWLRALPTTACVN